MFMHSDKYCKQSLGYKMPIETKLSSCTDVKKFSDNVAVEIEPGTKMKVELENAHEADNYIIGQGTYTVTNAKGSIIDDSK